jgi:hypothetical protein
MWLCDLSTLGASAFIAGVKANFPDAKITFDKFHVIKLVGSLLDLIQRGLKLAPPSLGHSVMRGIGSDFTDFQWKGIGPTPRQLMAYFTRLK